ncbi:hypothetical protein PTTG_08188 [Puccinia triticina 1-1 BBBD Race 1]|uniref:Uncharacterized protein n=1 Tax=Puccinia triticina (isolate 1-1 / race 1 (BBBD)) TaxID=630390 RepID=A0A180G4D1_PUCT1|nr:hypothetical protein PTTG_08188 [Puccinia triticina 1-1 BBBD Race 1]
MATAQPPSTSPRQAQPASELAIQALRDNPIQPRPPPVIRQNRTGRAVGSQGYSAADMTVLAECVSAVLPLGTTEWNEVLDKYNSYAGKAGRALRQSHSLRTKFRNLVHQPVVDDSPGYIRVAKQAAKAIDQRSKLLVSQDPNWAESDEEKGTGTPMQISTGLTGIEDGPIEEIADDSRERRPIDPSIQVEPNGNPAANPAAPVRSSEERSQSSTSPEMLSAASLQSVRRSATSPLRSAARSAPARSLQRPGPTNTHPPRSNHFSPMGSRDRQDFSSTGVTGRRVRGSTSGCSNTMRDCLEPEPGSSNSSSQQRDTDRSLVDFYSQRLHEANATIIRLQDEARRGNEVQASRLQSLEDENRRLRDNLLQQTVKAECLQGQLEMMGRLWDLSKASSFALFQPSANNQQPLNNAPPFPNFNIPPSASAILQMPHLHPPTPSDQHNPNQNLPPLVSMSIGSSSVPAQPHPLSSVPTSTALEEHSQVGTSAAF